INPEPYAREVGDRFISWLQLLEEWDDTPTEIKRWLVKPLGGERPLVQVPGMPLKLPYRWIHERGSAPPRISDVLIDRGLAVPGIDKEGRRWVRMERHLAQIYVTALADRVAKANDMPL